MESLPGYGDRFERPHYGYNVEPSSPEGGLQYLRDRWMFNRVLCEEEVCRKVLRAALGIEVGEIAYLNAEQAKEPAASAWTRSPGREAACSASRCRSPPRMLPIAMKCSRSSGWKGPNKHQRKRTGRWMSSAGEGCCLSDIKILH